MTLINVKKLKRYLRLKENYLNNKWLYDCNQHYFMRGIR